MLRYRNDSAQSRCIIILTSLSLTFRYSSHTSLSKNVDDFVLFVNILLRLTEQASVRKVCLRNIQGSIIFVGHSDIVEGSVEGRSLVPFFFLGEAGDAAIEHVSHYTTLSLIIDLMDPAIQLFTASVNGSWIALLYCLLE
jgi:hypothetical protein